MSRVMTIFVTFVHDVYLAKDSIIRRMNCKCINCLRGLIGLVEKLLLPFGASARRRLCLWDNILCYVICARVVSVKSWHSEETNESIRLFVQSR